MLSNLSGIDPSLAVPVGGRPVEVGYDSGLTLEAEAFSADYADTGQPLDYVSHLIVRSGDQVLAEKDVRVNQPLRVNGIKFHQAFYGIAADVTAVGANGQTLFEDTVPLRWTSTDGSVSIGIFELPDLQLEVRVLTPASGMTATGLAAGQAAFQLFRLGQNEPLTMEVADPGQPVKVGDINLTFQRERQYTGIMVRQDPGAIWMWIGSALLVAGMLVTFTCRQRRLWIRLESPTARLRLASADKADPAFARQFQTIAQAMAQLDQVLTAAESISDQASSS
jgi:cytochrome c biogenesis protein